MRNIKLILLITLALILSLSTYGQEKNEYQNKVQAEKLPVEVKKEIQNFSGYTVKSAAYKLENNTRVYKVQIVSGKMEHFLIIDEKGKIIGREEN